VLEAVRIRLPRGRPRQRPVATRYEKLAIQYLAMLSVSLIEKYPSVLFANTAQHDWRGQI
jgi:hypothetical protein